MMDGDDDFALNIVAPSAPKPAAPKRKPMAPPAGTHTHAPTHTHTHTSTHTPAVAAQTVPAARPAHATATVAGKMHTLAEARPPSSMGSAPGPASTSTSMPERARGRDTHTHTHARTHTDAHAHTEAHTHAGRHGGAPAAGASDAAPAGSGRRGWDGLDRTRVHTPAVVRASAPTHAHTHTHTHTRATHARADAGTRETPKAGPAAPAVTLARVAADSVDGADTFSGLGLLPRIVEKLTADRVSGAGGLHFSTTVHANAHAQGQAGGAAAAASSGIMRGHLRDGFGLTRPTRVQRAMIPRAFRGESLLVKSETGSGKTLAFLLPIVHVLARLLSSPGEEGEEYVSPQLKAAVTGATGLDRGAGTLGIILAPTRELCQQILGVLSRLAQAFPQIVPGIVAGGEKRKSEKARLRKGVTLLVATPGRLLDHLQTTESFCVDHLSWLVMDEADRLLDMGFGPQIAEIMAILRSRIARAPTAKIMAPWQTFLLSATLNKDVKSLAQTVLQGAVQAGDNATAAAPVITMIDASVAAMGKTEAELADEEGDEGAEQPATGSTDAKPMPVAHGDGDDTASSVVSADVADASAAAAEKPAAPAAQVFSTPSTLTQSYMLVPLKWRLVTILATVFDTFRRLSRARKERARAGAKMILFFSTCDGVDFHYELLHRLLPAMLKGPSGDDGKGKAAHGPTRLPLFRLHGDIPQSERTSTYRAFMATTDGLLIATDVASRGLDLPAVDVIIQADAPSDTMDYVHRVGRTARKGESGAAILMLQPVEAAYVDVLRASGLRIDALDTAPILNALSHAGIPEGVLSLPLVPGAAAPSSAGHDDAKDTTEREGLARAGVSDDMLRELLPASRAGSKRPREEEDRRGDVTTPALPPRLEHLQKAARERQLRARNAGETSDEAVRAAEMWAALWQSIAEEAVLRLPRLSAEAAGAAAGKLRADDTLLALARHAYTAFVRGYATHERAVRHIFHPRALHLGHAAKAFGLREAPTTVVAKDRKRSAREAAAAAHATVAEATHGRPRGAGHEARRGESAQRRGGFGGARPGSASGRTASALPNGAGTRAASGMPIKKRREISEFDA